MEKTDKTYMVQYGVWPNCCNNCDFCLRVNRDTLGKSEMIGRIREIRDNIGTIDWTGKFSAGISLLGGELYFVTDPDIQDEFMLLIDDIIDRILFVSPDPNVRYSTVTNGLYDPAFLFRVIDRIRDRAGICHVDANFSYDLKYRFRNEGDRKLCLENINKFIKRYDYELGVQMIVTQYMIDAVMSGDWDIGKFIKEEIPGGKLCLLYPHPVHTGKTLKDFNFRRKDLIRFALFLKDHFPDRFRDFMMSTSNSGTFKYTGCRDPKLGPEQPPILSDGKEIINPECGHSTLYQCYSDSSRCLNCDLLRIGGEL